MADARCPCPRGSHQVGLKAKAGPSGLLRPKVAGLSKNTLPLQACPWPSTQTWINRGLDGPGQRCGGGSSTDLLWSILNASALALLHKTQRDNASESEDCWMCFSASLHFYEGIALFENFTLLSDTRQLPLESVQLTLTELSGVRSCVLGPDMLRGPC